METQKTNQSIGQSTAHLFDGINRKLEHHRHDLCAVGFRCVFGAQECRKLHGKLGTRHRIAILNNIGKYAGVEAGLGFTTHVQEPI
jgi:hypothetical protein